MEVLLTETGVEERMKKESSLRLPRVNKWPTVGVGL